MDWAISAVLCHVFFKTLPLLIYVEAMHATVHMQKSAQIVGVGSLLIPWGVGLEASEPFHQPYVMYCI